MLTGILLANGNISASILSSLFNENLVKEGNPEQPITWKCQHSRRGLCDQLHYDTWCFCDDAHVILSKFVTFYLIYLACWNIFNGLAVRCTRLKWWCYNGLVAGVSAAFAVKLFKSWINEKDINSVAASLRKVGMDNRLMVKFTRRYWGTVLSVCVCVHDLSDVHQRCCSTARWFASVRVPWLLAL